MLQASTSYSTRSNNNNTQSTSTSTSTSLSVSGPRSLSTVPVPPAARTRSKTKVAIYRDENDQENPFVVDVGPAIVKAPTRAKGGVSARKALGAKSMNVVRPDQFGQAGSGADKKSEKGKGGTMEKLGWGNVGGGMSLNGKRKATDTEERPMKMPRRDRDRDRDMVKETGTATRDPAGSISSGRPIPLKEKTSTPKKIAKFFSGIATPGKIFTPGRHKGKVFGRSHTPGRPTTGPGPGPGPAPTPARALLSPKKRPLSTPGPAQHATSTGNTGNNDGEEVGGDEDEEEDEDEDEDADSYIPRPPTPPRPHIDTRSPTKRSQPPASASTATTVTATASTSISTSASATKSTPDLAPRPTLASTPTIVQGAGAAPRLPVMEPTSPFTDDLFSPKASTAGIKRQFAGTPDNGDNGDKASGPERKRPVVRANVSFSPSKSSTPKGVHDLGGDGATRRTSVLSPKKMLPPPSGPQRAHVVKPRSPSTSPAQAKAEIGPEVTKRPVCSVQDVGQAKLVNATPIDTAIRPKAENVPPKTETSGLPQPTRIPSASRLPRSSAPPGSSISSLSTDPVKPPSTKMSMPPPSAFPGNRATSREAATPASLGKGFPSSTTTPSTKSTVTAGASAPERPSGTSMADGEHRRKPSYPSSLGSGLPPRPPSYSLPGATGTKSILRPTSSSSSTSSASGQEGISGLPPSSIPRFSIPNSNRVVSEPTPRHQSASSVSSSQHLTASTAAAGATAATATTTTREGISAETSESLAGLSNALSKLKTKRAVSISVPPAQTKRSVTITSTTSTTSSRTASTRTSPEAPSEPGSRSVSASTTTSARIASIHRPRHSYLEPGDQSVISDGDGEGGSAAAADRSLAALMASSGGSKCLKRVVAFVDVKTAEGDDASVIFSDILRSLGARVISRLTDNVTHVVYKSGKQTTLAWWRRQDEDDRPYIVGISWVTKCKEKGERVDEEAYAVRVDDEDIFQKRRKSMQPRMLMSREQKLQVLDDAENALNATNLKRRSMINAPRVESPLKKSH